MGVSRISPDEDLGLVADNTTTAAPSPTPAATASTATRVDDEPGQIGLKPRMSFDEFRGTMLGIIRDSTRSPDDRLTAIHDLSRQEGYSPPDDQVIAAIKYGDAQVVKGTPAKQRDHGAGYAFIDKTANAATFGFADELRSGLRATGAKVTGSPQSWTDLFRENQRDAEDQLDADAYYHPTASLAGTLYGMVGTAPLAEVRPFQIAADAGRGARILASAGNSAASAGLQGTLYGFGSTDGSLGDRVAGAVKGGTVAAAIGAPLGAGGRAVREAVGTGAEGREVYDAATRLDARLGTDVTDHLLPADVGGTGTRLATAAAGTTFAHVPIAKASQEAVDAVASARDAMAQSAGVVRDPVGAGQVAQRGMRDSLDRWAGREVGYYEAIPIAPTSNAVVSNTQTALGDLTSRFSSNPEMAAAMSDPRIARWASAMTPKTLRTATGVLDASEKPIMRETMAGGNLSWQDLKAFRTDVGEMMGARVLADSPARSTLKPLYRALSEDMRATANAAGPDASAAFNRANTYSSRLSNYREQAAVEVLGRDLQQGSQPAFEQIVRLAAAKGGDPNMLRRVWMGLGEPARSSIRASILDQAGNATAANQNAAGDALSVSGIGTWWHKLAPRAQRLLFTGEQQRAINDLVTVASGMKAANKFANTSNTATAVHIIHFLSKLAPTAAGGMLGGVPGAAAGLGAQLTLGKVLASPRLVRTLVSAMRSPSDPAARSILGRIGATVQGEHLGRDALVSLRTLLLDRSPHKPADHGDPQFDITDDYADVPAVPLDANDLAPSPDEPEGGDVTDPQSVDPNADPERQP